MGSKLTKVKGPCSYLHRYSGERQDWVLSTQRECHPRLIPESIFKARLIISQCQVTKLPGPSLTNCLPK